MLYPKNPEYKLNFQKIKSLVQEACTSSLGRAYVEKITFSSDQKLVQKLLDQTSEFRDILISGEVFPSSNFTDLGPFLEKAKLEGAYLDEGEFHEIKLALQTLKSCINFLVKQEEKYPCLAQLLGMVMEVDLGLLKEIERIIDEKGTLRSNASKELQLIRSQIIYEETRLRKVMDRIFKEAKAKGLAVEDMEISIRSGRMVIPVAAENKRKIRGFIHDESATGQTVFMEPEEALDINNEIRDLYYMERREVIRILTSLTNHLRPAIPALRKATDFLGLMDFIRAKAKFALKTNSQRPMLGKQRFMQWKDARHPLLELALTSQGKSIVPLSLLLEEDRRLLVISGPNAGGKSVTLKTVALLQYMLQCGLLIPVHPDSTCCLFQNFFIDIGDEQNLENDLSTYSSHLMSMRYFTEFSNPKTILFIDEFGTGTEPQFGGAIAEAVLRELNRIGVFGVITTHYGNLKQLASKQKGLVNGAMRYDIKALRPLYELQLGKPGSSFALEIASSIGIGKEILDYAKNQIGEERVNYDKLLTQIENEKNTYSQLLKSVQEKEKLLKVRLQEYNQLKETLEQAKKRILQEAKEQAKSLLAETNKKIEGTIRTIQETKADKQRTKEVRQDLQTYKKQIQPEKPSQKAHFRPSEEELKPGDWVRLKDNGAIAQILNLKNKEAELSIGELKSVVKISRLEKVTRTEVRKKVSSTGSSAQHTQMKLLDFSTNLDLRGKRAEEILSILENFVDEGYMLGVKELRIIHGKGNGILRDTTRNLLKTMPTVQKMQDEHADLGGAGVTIVTLN